jgi:hypothetical protein
MGHLLNHPAISRPWCRGRTEPTQPATKVRSVTFTVEALSSIWWLLHRSDGRSGAVFDCRETALRFVRSESRALPLAIVESIDILRATTTEIYVFGQRTAASQEAYFSAIDTCH